MFKYAYIPNPRRIEHYFSPERDFPGRPQGAGYKYVLCSSPRSGSTLVASMLHATGFAGDPIEYLNDQWINAQMRSNSSGVSDFNTENYLAEWEKRRTSPNGVFGIKLHFHQMRRAWGRVEHEAARFLGDYDQRILLSRRDKIAQAVSLYRALASQVWSSRDSRHLNVNNSNYKSLKVDFDAARIAQLMTYLIKEEECWRDFMTANNLPFAELCYEDFVGDYVGQSVQLLKILGLEFKAEAIPPPQLARQSQINDPMIEQFKQAIGLHTGTNTP